MDTFELNKIVGAVLAAVLTMTVIGFIARGLIAPHPIAQNAYPVAVAEAPKPAEAAAEAPKIEPIAPLLAAANVQAGQAAAKACAACHTFDKGGRNGVGPNLWGTVGRDKASVQGFNYSQALQAAPGEWTYEDLNQFIANPRGYLPGTRMAYAGLRRAEERTNLIAWLRTQSDNPPPLP